MKLSFIKNQTLWIAIASVTSIVSLILSQFPPIKDLLRGTNIIVYSGDKCSISHYFGNIDIEMPINIVNNGGSKVTISKIKCIINYPDGSIIDLISQDIITASNNIHFYPSISNKQPIKIITLFPGEKWNETTCFYKKYSEQEEEELDEMYMKMAENIKSKIMTPRFIMGLVTPPTQIEIDEPIVKEAQSMFKKNFNLMKGTYKLFIIPISDLNKFISITGYEFTIFESHIKNLVKISQTYKYGESILRPSSDIRSAARVNLRHISEAQAKTILKRIGAIQ